MHIIQFMEYNAYSTVHRIQYAMLLIKCRDYNTYDTIHKTKDGQY